MDGKFRQFIHVHTGGFGAGLRFSSRFVDVLLAPFILELAVFYAYLAARVVTLFMPLALELVGRKAAPQLASLARMDGQTPFQAAAARINLGYLMICGGGGVVLLALAPFANIVFNGLDPAFNDILLWLVIGQSAPVLFGATGLLMHAVDRAAFYDVLQGMTALLFVGSIVWLDVNKGGQVAQTFAAAQLTQAALCALLLTQCGVWPGLTALFKKQIKLF
ncbi:MAG: hypothetical protein ABJP06_03455 [Sulfitobacter sp.]